MNSEQWHTNDLNQETGASAWLTTQPLKQKDIPLPNNYFGISFLLDTDGNFQESPYSRLSVIIYSQIWLNLVMLCETSKEFSNYQQISSEFITNLTELRMLWEDDASQSKTKARQVGWELLVLKHNKLKIKIVENRTSINKSYLYLYCLYLKFCRLASNFISKNIQNVRIWKDTDQKN